ncbi:hypothetical protein U91I_03782 [alpha proteobacterium U9-1i]|nr:hypothetical protein U91I_03782 [alpha proteobacterium U9-1i]
MRLPLVCAALASLLSCAPQERAGACDVRHEREVMFANGGAQETVTARAFGASCDKAIALYTIHDGEGHPVWSWTAPMARAFGDQFAAAEEEQLTTFIERWAQPHITTTEEAPPWGALEPGQTTLDELTYDDLRARNLPMLCHLTSVARESCVFWEPAAGGAGLLYERLATAAEEEAG